jgi:WhiB family redox-sensing transcriptional regulator
VTPEPNVTWQSQGACKGSDPDQYFPHPYVSHAQIVSIRAVCEACPVRRECADWGIHHEQLGIWGGTTDRQRREIRRKLGIILDTPKTERLYNRRSA